MSRHVRQDLDSLIDFISRYDISDIPKDKLSHISQLHKQYYAVISIQYELISIFNNPTDETVRNYINEWSSDINSAFFTWIHGAYKPARLMLRSSMENFIKFTLFPTDNTITTVKNVYEIFNRFSCNFHNSNPVITTYMSNFHSIYSDLCQDVHSSGTKNLAQIDCLSRFPKFENDQSLQFIKIMKKSIECYFVFISIEYAQYINAFHHHNEDMIWSMIPKATIKKIRKT